MINLNVRLWQRAEFPGHGAAQRCSCLSGADVVVNRLVIIVYSVKGMELGVGGGPPGSSVERRLAVPCAVCTFPKASRYTSVKWWM